MEYEPEFFLQIKKGNRESFEKLFMTFYAPLCHFSRRYIADRDDCEEVVQDFFLKLWEKRMEIEINSSVKNYLFSSVRNRCLNYIKHQKIKLEYRGEALKTHETSFDPDQYILEFDLEEKIREGIDSLPQRRREIFIMSRDHGLKYREIAEQLGISIKTVETQMGQALKDLREKLKDYRRLLISFLFFSPAMNRGVDPIGCLTGTKKESKKRRLC